MGVINSLGLECLQLTLLLTTNIGREVGALEETKGVPEGLLDVTLTGGRWGLVLVVLMGTGCHNGSGHVDTSEGKVARERPRKDSRRTRGLPPNQSN
jgi:hypothetical protein